MRHAMRSLKVHLVGGLLSFQRDCVNGAVRHSLEGGPFLFLASPEERAQFPQLLLSSLSLSLHSSSFCWWNACSYTLCIASLPLCVFASCVEYPLFSQPLQGGAPPPPRVALKKITHDVNFPPRGLTSGEKQITSPGGRLRNVR